MLRTLCLSLGLAFAPIASAVACFSPPADYSAGHVDAIDRAEWIALVRAGRGPDSGLEVIEYLKGTGPPVLDIGYIGYDLDTRNDSALPRPGNFYGHATSLFWTGERGGQGVGPDCQMHPGFAPGQTYLVFGPQEFGVGYENVTREGDLWVEFVRARLADASVEPPYPMSLEAYLAAAEAVFLLDIEMSDGVVTVEETIWKGEEESYQGVVFPAPPLFFRLFEPDCLTYRFGPIDPLRQFRRQAVYVVERIPDDPVWAYQHNTCPFPGQLADGRQWGEFVGTYEARGLFSENASTTLEVVGGDIQVSRPFDLRPIAIGDSGAAIERIPLAEFERLARAAPPRPDPLPGR